MPENSSKFLRFNVKDFSKGLALAVIGAVLAVFQQAFATNGFDFSAFDWVGIFQFAVSAGATYLAKNLLSTEDGRVLGRIG